MTNKMAQPAVRSRQGILQNMKIGRKLALLIGICLLSFALFFAVAQMGLNTVKIGGDIYSNIVNGKDLVADILPPPAYIIESYLIAHQMYQDIGTAAVDDEISRCESLKKDYDARHEFWLENLQGDDIRRVFLEESYQPAIAFFDVLFNQYIPAVKAQDKNKASELLNNTMKANYEAHRAAVDKVVVMANTQNEKDFLYSEQVLQTTQLIEWLVAGALFVVSIVIGWLVTRSISRPVKATAKCAHALAEGKLDAPLDVCSHDEVGELAAIIGGNVRGAFQEIEQARGVSEKKARYQSAEAEKLLNNLQRLSEGNLGFYMEVGEADADTADLHELFNGIAENLGGALGTIQSYIGEISSNLGNMADGNLDICITNEYRGEFIALKESINGIANSLNTVLSEIHAAANQVAAGTRQVSDSSQSISLGATQQAGAIEELTVSISQIAQQTRQNASDAGKASELAVTAASNAAKGNEQMKAMRQAMEEISASSHSIGRIIKVIDDIAFQTNILALNAAVEAARAGAHGKGFAVVAEEVRNLAARSASAAKETTELIESSIIKTDAGTKIAAETADAFVSIVKGVEAAAQLISDIAVQSGEQAGAITQVDNGIEQMTAVVQTNSAASEQTAATAQELSSQADLLKDMVSKFNVRYAFGVPEAARQPYCPDAQLKSDLSDPDFGKY